MVCCTDLSLGPPTPTDTTYIFFGRRGSGKTTIRLQMQRAYAQYNESVRAFGQSRGHFMVDLSRPGHLTACLRNFQEHIGCTDDNWDAAFGGFWGGGGGGGWRVQPVPGLCRDLRMAARGRAARPCVRVWSVRALAWIWTGWAAACLARVLRA